MLDNPKRDYEVGYGKPPRHSRFRQGESGNPRGRPRGASNLATLLDRALNERVVVSENGRRKRITKREAVLKQLVNKAASGDPKSIYLLLAEMRQVEGREAPPAESLLFDQTDREVIRHLYERLHQGGQESKEG
jgi:hypothetical protein